MFNFLFMLSLTLFECFLPLPFLYVFTCCAGLTELSWSLYKVYFDRRSTSASLWIVLDQCSHGSAASSQAFKNCMMLYTENMMVVICVLPLYATLTMISQKVLGQPGLISQSKYFKLSYRFKNFIKCFD